MDKVYMEMLQDAGILEKVDNAEREIQQALDKQYGENKHDNDLVCCGRVQSYYSDGNMVCFDCGKVFTNQQKLMYYSSYQDGGGSGNVSTYGRGMKRNDGVTFTKKRYYRPHSHFRDHLRRYIGCDSPPPSCIEEQVKQSVSDINDPMAYYIVKSVLKKLGKPQYYRSIFTIIYRCGGTKPQISSATFQQAEKQFSAMAHYFHQHRDKFKRKSVPSMYMMLDLILRNCGHVPHYFIPQLKDSQLRQNVLDFYVQYARDKFRVGGVQGNDTVDAETLVQVYPDLSVLCGRQFACEEPDERDAVEQ